MSIEVHCEGCGKLLRAPRESAGKQTKCPACEHSVYIPTPEDEIEELPLAPEDAADLQRKADLQAERRALERLLGREEATSGGGAKAAHASAGGGAAGPDRPSPGAGGRSIQETVIAYLVALRDSDLARADEALAILQPRAPEARKVLDQLAADQIPPAEMASVPPAVYQGFLKNLRSRL